MNDLNDSEKIEMSIDGGEPFIKKSYLETLLKQMGAHLVENSNKWRFREYLIFIEYRGIDEIKKNSPENFIKNISLELKHSQIGERKVLDYMGTILFRKTFDQMPEFNNYYNNFIDYLKNNN